MGPGNSGIPLGLTLAQYLSLLNTSAVFAGFQAGHCITYVATDLSVSSIELLLMGLAVLKALSLRLRRSLWLEVWEMHA